MVKRLISYSVLMLLLVSCNMPLGQPPGTEQFINPGTGPWKTYPLEPYILYYSEREPKVSSDPVTGEPTPAANTNDNMVTAEHIGTEGDYIIQRSNAILGIKGSISGLAGTHYKNKNSWRNVELREYRRYIVCMSSDGKNTSRLRASPDDYYYFNSGIHFQNIYKTHGIIGLLTWKGGERGVETVSTPIGYNINLITTQALSTAEYPKMALYSCDRDTGQWVYQDVFRDYMINLDLYAYKLTREGDFEVVDDTEGYWRNPEIVAIYPDILMPPWQYVDYYIRVSIRGDRYSWVFEEEQDVGNYIFDVNYVLLLLIEMQ